MTFTELAQARYTVRSYNIRPIGQEKLFQALEAGHVYMQGKRT